MLPRPWNRAKADGLLLLFGESDFGDFRVDVPELAHEAAGAVDRRHPEGGSIGDM